MRSDPVKYLRKELSRVFADWRAGMIDIGASLEDLDAALASLALPEPESAAPGWDTPCGKCECGIYDERALAAFDGNVPKCKQLDRQCVGAVHALIVQQANAPGKQSERCTHGVRNPHPCRECEDGPSAPVGVTEAFEAYHKADHRDPAVAPEWQWWQAGWKAALAQQPAADMRDRLLAALERAAAAETALARMRGQQPAAVDEAMVGRFCRRWYEITGRSLERVHVLASLDSALAGQQQEAR